MGMIRVFLKDFVTRRRITGCMVSLVVLAGLLGVFDPQKYASDVGAGVLGIMVCFFPTMYIIYTYATFENLRLYLTMPVSAHKTIFSFGAALFADTVLERMSLAAVAIVFLFRRPVPAILFLLLSGLVTVLINLVILLGMNSRQAGVTMLGFGMFLALVAVCVMISNQLIRAGATVLIGAACAGLMMRHSSLDLAVTRKGIKTGKLGRNYFWTVLFSERMYVLNTVFVLAFAAVFLFGFAEGENPILTSIVWCVAAVNTPVTTMISGDKALIRQSDMLPDAQGAIMGMYRRFLLSYFAITNGFVFVLCAIKAGSFAPYILLQYAAAVIIEVLATMYMEQHKRITGWQTKQQLWRNPRKYIVPVSVFLVNAVIAMLLSKQL